MSKADRQSNIETIEVQNYVPNYKRKCGNCDQRPTVECITVQGKRVRIADLCGPCTFGTAEALDPHLWDKLH